MLTIWVFVEVARFLQHTVLKKKEPCKKVPKMPCLLDYEVKIVFFENKCNLFPKASV